MGALERKQNEERLLDRANAQFGLLRLEDLEELGVTRNALRARRVTCRLNRVQAGVYAFGHTALRDEGRWLAALWTCGDGAVLSHWTAAALHGLDVAPPDDRVHLSTAGTAHGRDGLVVHRVGALGYPDVHRADPLRFTSVPRTLVDLADVMDWQAFRTLADGLRVLPVRQIRAAQARAPMRPGRGLVDRLLDADDAHTKSEFERRFLRVLRARGLPRPDHLNHRVAGHKADAVFTAARLVVELDGRAHHRRRAQMRADRRRDIDLQLAGHLATRFVWDDFHPSAAAATERTLRLLLRLTPEA